MHFSRLPPWGHRVLDENYAFEIENLTVRRIDFLDLLSQENKFRLIADSSDLNFLLYRLNNREMLEARNNGLFVSVFIPNGVRMELLMTIYDDRADVNLTGYEAELTQIFSWIKDGDVVGIWMFRHFLYNDGEAKLCFIIVKLN